MRVLCADSVIEAKAGRKPWKNAEGDTWLKRWTWRRQPLQIIDLKDIPKVDFSKWDHPKRNHLAQQA